jgi:DNA-binding transcriptional ArsR family regulator
MLNTAIDERTSQYIANTFNALADPTRLKIINLLLKHDNKCVSELEAELGISVSAASQSCRILELNHLLRRPRQGQKICYQVRLDDPFVRKIVKFVSPKEESPNG